MVRFFNSFIKRCDILLKKISPKCAEWIFWRDFSRKQVILLKKRKGRRRHLTHLDRYMLSNRDYDYGFYYGRLTWLKDLRDRIKKEKVKKG